LPLESPLTEREERQLHHVEPTLSRNPPGIDLPDVLRRFAASIQTEINASGGGGDASQIVYDPAASGLTAIQVQAAIDEVVANLAAGTGVGLDVKANLHAVGTFVTNAAAATMMTGAGADDDMEYIVPAGGDGDYLVMWSGNIRTTDAGREVIASLAKNGASVNGSDRMHNFNTSVVPAASQDVFTGVVATDTLSARLRRDTGGGGPFDVECTERSILVIKVG